MPHLRSHLVRRGVFALALVALAAVSGIWALDADETQAGGGSMTAMSVDTNITGNTATSLGANDTTVALNPCDDFTWDVTALDIPSSNPMIGLGFTLRYDASNIEILTSDPDFLLTSEPMSTLFDPGPAFIPDGVTVSALDIANGAEESGSGVLARITGTVLPAAAEGNYPITLTDAAHLDVLNEAQLPTSLIGATVSLAGSCNGDVDCSLAANSVDSLKVLRHNAGLSVSQTEPCANIGIDIGPRNQGDVDCSGTVSSVDSLKILRAAASLSVSQTQPCPPIVP